MKEFTTHRAAKGDSLKKVLTLRAHGVYMLGKSFFNFVLELELKDEKEKKTQRKEVFSFLH